MHVDGMCVCVGPMDSKQRCSRPKLSVFTKYLSCIRKCHAICLLPSEAVVTKLSMFSRLAQHRNYMPHNYVYYKHKLIAFDGGQVSTKSSHFLTLDFLLPVGLAKNVGSSWSKETPLVANNLWALCCKVPPHLSPLLFSSTFKQSNPRDSSSSAVVKLSRGNSIWKENY